MPSWGRDSQVQEISYSGLGMFSRDGCPAGHLASPGSWPWNGTTKASRGHGGTRAGTERGGDSENQWVCGLAFLSLALMPDTIGLFLVGYVPGKNAFV